MNNLKHKKYFDLGPCNFKADFSNLNQKEISQQRNSKFYYYKTITLHILSGLTKGVIIIQLLKSTFFRLNAKVFKKINSRLMHQYIIGRQKTSFRFK